MTRRKIQEIPETPEVFNCKKHGEYEERYMPWVGGGYYAFSYCPKCAEDEKAIEEEREKQKSIEIQEKRLLSMKIKAGVSPRNVDVKFSSFSASTPQMEVAKKKVYSFARGIYDGNNVSSLILSGKVGTGKTMLACATINALIESKKCRMVKLIDMFRELKDTWRKESSKTELELISWYSKLDLLVIDEVGVNYDSDTEKMFIFDIIDGRYQNMKPTMIISNLGIDGIKGLIGDRAYDRLKDGGGEVVAFDWESQRG